MKLEGTHTFDAPADRVWPMLLDPDVLAKVMPGCERLEQVAENSYEGVLQVRVGPVQGKFDGRIELNNINAPESYEMSLDGRGPAGFVQGSGSVRLEPDGDGSAMHYSGDVQVGGRIASVGQRLMETSARAIIRQSLDGLDQQVQARMTPAATTANEAPPSPEAPTQTQFAVGVAKNFAEELTQTEEGRDLLLRAGLVVGGLLVAWLINNWWMNRLARRVARIIQEEGGS